MPETDSYSVTSRGFGPVDTIVLSDPENNAEAHVAPSLGFNCFKFTREVHGQAIDILAVPESGEALAESASSYGYPILFPFPNRVRAGKYKVQGKEYQLAINKGGHHIHGLVRDLAWQVAETGVNDTLGAFATGVIQSSELSPEAREQFPFSFLLSVRYSLKSGKLSVDICVTNIGDGVLPMGFGAHCYFPVPIDPRSRREQCEISVPANRTWVLDECIPTGEIRPVSDHLDLRQPRSLGDQTYDDVLTDVCSDDDYSTCRLHDPEAGLEIRICADRAHREWVVYAPSNRPVVAFEPYSCATDAVNLQAHGIDAGWLELAPGEFWTGKQAISLKKS